ncbi:hypothetical protein [uncultured Tateyamaria sp.]|uniref:hypothetical protein n=1 Tax=Tateyamaria sp. 1078 TaxID=3417464 RepID=UPI0026314BAB|nr:hypothetical protein [uncultured Tateyamaria sp.]
MIAFLSSISWLGWALIVLLACTLWQLPAILRMGVGGKGFAMRRKRMPGEMSGLSDRDEV